MSILPQYTKVQDVEENQPLWKGRASLEQGEEVPAYPPQMGEGSGNRRAPNVTYIWNPRYPVKGEKEEVLGVFSASKQKTIEYLRRGFPTLSEYPDERIEFLVTNEIEGKSDTWARVLDEAWVGFEDSPPKRMTVQITDGPGDAKARHWRENALPMILVFAPILIALLLVAIFAGLGFFD